MDTLLIIIVIVIAFLIYMLIRNNKTYNFLMRLLHEESEYCQKRMWANKGYDGFRRHDTLPDYVRIWLTFWHPLSYWERPLSDFYTEDKETANEA